MTHSAVTKAVHVSAADRLAEYLDVSVLRLEPSSAVARAAARHWPDK